MTPTSEPLGELALVEPRSAHCAVSLALGHSLGRQRDDQAPLRRRRTRYILVMRHSPEDHFVEQILGPGERLVAVFALAPAVRQVGEIDDEAAPSAAIKSTGQAAASDTRFTPPSYRRSRIVKPSCLRTPCKRPVFRSPLPVGT